MSDKEFIWSNDLDGNSTAQKFNVKSTVFGDGYEQNVSVGINNRKGEWVYQRTAYNTETLAIKAFFDEHKGADSFWWQSPSDGRVKVKTDITYTHVCLGSDVWRISTTFKQQF